MHALGVVFIDVVVALFFIGLAGSAVVVLISFVEDFRELFASDESAPEPAHSIQATSTTSTGASFSTSRLSAK
jgi:hypothetical protein